MKTTLTLFLAAALPLAAQSKAPTKQMTDPNAVHAHALVIDTHADTPQRFLDEGFDFAGPLNGGMLSLDTAKQGNLDAEFFSIWVEPTQYKGQYAHRTLALIDAVLQQAARHPDKMRMAYSAEDIVAAHRDHKFAALMGIEGGHSIEADLGLLRDYYRLGVRYMTLTWSNTNEWADSSGDINDTAIQHHDGLTPFGKDVVREMNRLGMMVDISHVADKTFYDALAVTTAPVIASHSSARALTNHPRNMTDDMLRAMAKNNGVVMVNFFPAFIDANWLAAWQAQKPERDQATAQLAAAYKTKGEPMPYGASEKIDREYAAKIPRAPLSSLIDHIDHVIQVAGVDHTGIGSDFDGIPSTPEGIDSAADLPKITAALMARGYTAEDMRKVLGGNLLRVFTAVEKASVR